jgi:hypothetical protein
MKLFLILSFFFNYCFAEDTQNASSEKTFFEKSKENTLEALDYVKEKGTELKKQSDAKSAESVTLGQKHNSGLNVYYSPIDLIVPGKYGLGFVFSSEDKQSQYELQFIRASYSISALSVDFLKLTDQRLSVLKRNFSSTGNFNWFYGMSYISLEGTLGSSLLSQIVPSSDVENSELVNIKTLGFDLGLGHRWYFKNNFSISADWVGVSQPLIILKKEAAYLNTTTTSSSDKNNVKNGIDAATFLPRFFAVKLSLGYNF